MKSQQTDNSYLAEKLFLRQSYLPKKSDIKVLDCFSGDGIIWNNMQRNNQDKDIQVTSIEKKRKSGLYLKGDNVKFLLGMDLSKFDVIDLDAYGIPFKQMEIVLNSNPKNQIIFFTFIQVVFGKLPDDLLKELGYTQSMIRKCPSLFNHKGFEKFCGYISNYGVKKINYIQKKNKFYSALIT